VIPRPKVQDTENEACLSPQPSKSCPPKRKRLPVLERRIKKKNLVKEDKENDDIESDDEYTRLETSSTSETDDNFIKQRPTSILKSIVQIEESSQDSSYTSPKVNSTKKRRVVGMSTSKKMSVDALKMPLFSLDDNSSPVVKKK
jgi:hypothetical protein